jgi:transposase
VYYRWSKEFLEAGEKRLSGDILREATGPEVQSMKTENEAGSATFCVHLVHKQLFAELSLENKLLKKA